MKIAWIGTGIMGYPMVDHLIKAGFEVSVYNRTIKKASSLDARICTSIKETVKNADVIVTIVSLPEDVHMVYTEDGIFDHAKNEAICIDMTTSSPSLARELHALGKSRGLHCLDAPVSGGDVGAKNQTLTIMVGGDEDVFESMLPVFQHLGKTITYVGPAGSGQHMKMTNQIAVANNLMGAIESLAYAQSVGLDQQTAIHVLTKGAAGSWQLQVNGPLIAKQDFTPGFMNIHFIKDLRLVLEEAKKSNVSLPMVERVLELFASHTDPSFLHEATIAIYRDYIDH